MVVAIVAGRAKGKQEKAVTSSSMRMAAAAGLTNQPKTKHLNAKVQPALFAAAARRIGSDSPARVIEAALAALATQDSLGPWLADNWGSLADADSDLLMELTI